MINKAETQLRETNEDSLLCNTVKSGKGKEHRRQQQGEDMGQPRRRDGGWAGGGYHNPLGTRRDMNPTGEDASPRGVCLDPAKLPTRAQPAWCPEDQVLGKGNQRYALNNDLTQDERTVRSIKGG